MTSTETIPLRRFALVYQFGIVNLFEVECWNVASPGRGARLIRQGNFHSVAHFTQGLAEAGHLVETFSCGMAGNIADERWTVGLDACPFRESAIIVRQTKTKVS